MDVSICIVTHSQPVILRQCVAACMGEIERAQLTAEIIIIDNASSDGYPQSLAIPSPIIQVIRNNENLGFSAANNKAIRISRGRLVLILNDDALFQEGSLGLLVRELDSSPQNGAVGPKFLNPDGSFQRGFSNRRFPNLRGVLCQTLILEELLEKTGLTRDLLTLTRDPERSGKTDHLAGACLLVRRKALEAVDLFDERFRFWFEDVDLCWRLKAAGWRVIYLADARVTHYGSASFRKRAQPERDAIYFESLRYFCRKHFSPARYQLLRWGVAGALILRTGVGAWRRFWSADLTTQERREWTRARIRVARSLLWGPD